MRFTADFNTDNAAFDNDGNLEVARILREIADGVEAGRDTMLVHDFNGNKIGLAEFTD